MPAAKHPIQRVGDVAFYWKPPGYYKANHTKFGRAVYMHRYVWEQAHGPVPDGFHVHHINGDRGDNRLENLECVPGSDHQAAHMAERLADPEYRARLREQLDSVRHLAAAWHGTPEGRELSRRNSKRYWAEVEPTDHTCARCGAGYKVVAGSVKRGFCSPACQSAARRDSGVDDEQRPCCICGTAFTTNKYARTKTCSKACWKEAVSRGKRARVRPDGG